jgi:hypothetical protein
MGVSFTPHAFPEYFCLFLFLTISSESNVIKEWCPHCPRPGIHKLLRFLKNWYPISSITIVPRITIPMISRCESRDSGWSAGSPSEQTGMCAGCGVVRDSVIEVIDDVTLPVVFVVMGPIVPLDDVLEGEVVVSLSITIR